jgi:hypothetical protein
VLADYRLPYVMQLEERMILYRDADSMQQGLSRYREILIRHGVTEMRPRQRMTDSLGPGPFRAWVNTAFAGRLGKAFASGATVFFGRTDGEKVLFEMQHITHLPFAEFRYLAPSGHWIA